MHNTWIFLRVLTLSGGVSLVVGHPLDTVKTRLQTMNAYTGFQDCFAKTVRHESMLALYKGMFLPFLTSGVLHSLLFASYATTLKILNPDHHKRSKKENLPFKEVQRGSVHRKRFGSRWLGGTQTFQSPAARIRSIVEKNGIRGLYKGGSAMFFRDTIGICFYLPVYEALKYYLRQNDYNETLSEVFAGGVAGSSCWLSICPFEVIKNKAQTRSEFSHGRILLAARQIYGNEGIPGFYRGAGALMTRGFAVNAVLFVVYEKTLALFES